MRWFGVMASQLLVQSAFADILLFDLDKISMESDFLARARPAVGIEQVFRNGWVVYDEMALIDAEVVVPWEKGTFRRSWARM
jgi:N-acyl-D-aspartate/D-glutamate deacylase